MSTEGFRWWSLRVRWLTKTQNGRGTWGGHVSLCATLTPEGSHLSANINGGRREGHGRAEHRPGMPVWEVQLVACLAVLQILRLLLGLWGGG